MTSSPAPARRPELVLFDVFETCLQLEGLAERFAAIGRPASDVDLFFARLIHQGMAMTLAGGAPPFRAVAADMLRRTSGVDLTDAQVGHVLDGFATLPAQPDLLPALRLLADAGVPAHAFTHGSAAAAESALTAAGARDLLAGVHSCEVLGSFKPPARVYEWACAQVGSDPAATALVAVHSWDVHGAMSAGLLGGLALRLEGRVPDTVLPPHVTAQQLDGVVAGLLDLPA
ncbi:haloacid dehalogenase-like hydrolase [Pseudonocardia dioxanivorans CB1190]|uniref:Haloacid dehalogenase-like hydrolase n=1 Tax=Pseudonocardia dioxanivorans (strain ATCC 55486 / DSM 44775 / JCM 13855 / CB1190) TaxID=675635 RepID=F4D034_PSEUX|nr:HAD family hydrolase [Pseudonocardia dioxanivorans]AEA24867.1 haloacid dehalogenase-like hydrolase [Pseudonocardia dioxanivorans CB1190]GJF02688.1 hypothetical protein PSD17_16500 [Pseudonocardia sp. D17]